ncbi:hypothetical protein [Enterovibrio nigricans]|uniref:Uncharacterized protein n=1 Tax=Enterovibrio nigricans DSM 22720 TaxID=1121868 RepID=A0A1T4UP51_9GAMM|nr:hypothetical protein [Enterovibrio nigricans]PKF48708.1 hypothetical protein AT251_24155 [Enterovibrio nigricans]SKA54368.1 hypothetical protein SAMN02745132_02127 [Enterovibrio nigricans DSM 22720]
MPVAGWICNQLYGLPNYQPHLSADGYTLMGEYIAAAEQAVDNNVTKIAPPHPIAFRVLDDRHTIEIDFDNPWGNTLVLDESGSIVPVYAGRGFGMSSKANVDVILAMENVSLTTNTLTMRSPEFIEVGSTLWAGRINQGWSANPAYQIPCINLRDESDLVSPSLWIPLHNWAAQFEKTFTIDEVNVFDELSDNIWQSFVDSAFATPKNVKGLEPNYTAFGLSATYRLKENSTYQVEFDITIKADTFRLSVGSNSDGLRKSFTASGTYTRTVTVKSAKGLKADCLGEHDITLNAMSVRKVG